MEATATFPAWRANLAMIAALIARAKNELVRVPGAAIPGVLAPTIFFLGLNGVFGALTQLRGFSTGTYESSLIPATFVLTVALLLGAAFPGIDGLLVTYLMVAAMAAVAACWGSFLALHFKSQSAAPLMQAGTMAVILTTTAYAPLALLQGWLQDVARVNPVTQVVEAARQGFVGGVSWAETWPGILALAGLLAVLGALALREMRRTAL